MVQTLTPTSDLHVGAWRTDTDASTSLYAAIADVSEANYIQSEVSPNNSPYVVALGSATDPVSSTGHTVTWAHRNPESGTLNLTVELRQGVRVRSLPGHADRHLDRRRGCRGRSPPSPKPSPPAKPTRSPTTGRCRCVSSPTKREGPVAFTHRAGERRRRTDAATYPAPSPPSPAAVSCG